MSQPVREFVPVSCAKQTMTWFLASLGALVVLLGWSTAVTLWPTPIEYRVTTETLYVTVGRGANAEVTKVPLARISEIAPVELRGGALKFGTERPGLCQGFFTFPTLGGEVWMANTCASRGVLLRSSSMVAPLVLTPALRDTFVIAVREGRPGVFAPLPNRSGTRSVLVVRGLLLLVIAALLATMFLLAPRRLRYRVGPGTLEVQTLRDRTTIALDKARVRAHRPLVGQRLSGLPLPGYIVGSHELDNQPTIVFASTKDDGVLIEADGRYFVTPADRDGMLEALAAAGATLVTAAPQRRF